MDLLEKYGISKFESIKYWSDINEFVARYKNK